MTDSDKKYYIKHREKIRKQHKEYYQRNKHKWRKVSKHNWLKRLYNLSYDDYRQMATEQNNRCAVCDNFETEEGRGLSVDHNHKTGKIRNLLCGRCNRLLGHFESNPDLFKKIENYLKRWDGV